MKRNGWILTVVLCVAALQAWFIQRATERQADADAASARMASLESETARLRARTRALEDEARSRSAELEVRALAARAVTPREATPPAVAAPTAAPREEHRDETPLPPPSLETKLEQAFSQEAIDPSWAEPAARQAVDSFSARMPQGSSIRDVDCRGSLCLMEVEHRSSEGHAELLRALSQPPMPWDGPGSMSLTTRNSGEQVTRIFLGRPGSDLAEASAWR